MVFDSETSVARPVSDCRVRYGVTVICLMLVQSNAPKNGVD